MTVDLTKPPLAARVAAAVIARLDAEYTLWYPSYDDRLTNEQITALLAGENPYDDHKAFIHFEDVMSEHLYRAACDVITDLTTERELEILENDGGAHDEVRFAVQDRDTTDWVTALLRQTGSRLLRLDLDHEVPWLDHQVADDDDYEAALSDVASAAFLDLSSERRDVIDTILRESYAGGALYVLWYGDVESAVEWAGIEHGVATFTNANLLVLNHLSGSGFCEVIPGTFTVPLGAITLDAARIGPGYSWTDVAGPYEPAYAAEVTVTDTTLRWSAASLPGHQAAPSTLAKNGAARMTWDIATNDAGTWRVELTGSTADGHPTPAITLADCPDEEIAKASAQRYENLHALTPKGN